MMFADIAASRDCLTNIAATVIPLVDKSGCPLVGLVLAPLEFLTLSDESRLFKEKRFNTVSRVKALTSLRICETFLTRWIFHFSFQKRYLNEHIRCYIPKFASKKNIVIYKF